MGECGRTSSLGARQFLSENPFSEKLLWSGEGDRRRDSVVEDYQIAFSGDNFFLLGVTADITLTNSPLRMD
jgi:hypothetical protein